MRVIQQRGAALLIVLMVVALVAILATEMGARLQLQVQRASNIKSNNQAYWYAMSAEQFARKSLVTLMQETGEKIHLNQPWAQAFEYPMEGGGIEVYLEDMQSCFNLNALPNAGATGSTGQEPTEAMNAFARLLQYTDEDIPSYTIDTVRDSLADWLDDDDRMRAYGAEDSEYASRPYPYLAANSKMSSQSELRIVNGVEPEWLDKLLPQICVIPNNEKLLVNVNTLTEERAPVLAALTGLSVSQAASVISARPMDGWKDANAFLSEPDIAALNLKQEQTAWFAVTTEYFILHTKSRYNEASFAMSTVFNAGTSGNIAVLRREFGVIR
ncbi:type II secretion system minor pseudopilin GspK [Alteromonas gilva]|uniref:Type II secretion system protein K n=1 Tax=Alteromonas gilva TaxID=2987522 RepID=A0ABT5L0D7_9ALTE|nr:type II secretion system minor pseudopilin GspK [Alteromonas gilva]MDC8829342.1 type II secretion system minor pseudopilin GspK [Alteromonas gilva]